MDKKIVSITFQSDAQTQTRYEGLIIKKPDRLTH